MKARLITILAFFSFASYAQVYWEELTPLRDQENVIDLVFPTNARGYLAGSQSGTILRTDNSGASWTKLRLPLTTSSNFHEVCFINRDTGFFVGTSSYMTVNGCNSYTAFPASIVNIQSVWFTSTSTGFMAGASGKIYKTTNMGTSWNLLTSGTTMQLNSIHFANVDTGIAVGNNGVVVRTVDGGSTWNIISIPTTNFLESVQFIDDSTAFIAGDYASLYVTHDAGLTWSTVATSFSGASQTLYRMRFFNSTFGYAVGTGGYIAFTSDKGQTWTLSGISGYTNYFYSVGFRPDGTAFLGGVGKLWQTSDYANWAYNMIGVARSTLMDVEFIDSDTGFVCGYGGQNGDTYQTILRTNSNGKLWNAKNTNNDFSSNGFHSLTFSSPSNGFCGANSTSSAKTSNCGATWQQMSSFSGFGAPNDMQNFNATTSYACGGGVQVTTNAGTTWTNNIIPGAGLLYAMSFINPNLGYVCGVNGKVYKTTNACAAWTNISPLTGATLNTICFPTDSIGYVTGGSAAGYKTIDGGQTWTTMASGGLGIKYLFVNKDSGYVISSGGSLRKTVNGGTSFTTLVGGINNALIFGGGLYNNSVYAGGQGGTVLRHVLGCAGPPQLNGIISGTAVSCVFNTDTFRLPLYPGMAYQWDNMYGAQVNVDTVNRVSIQWQVPGIFYVKANVSNACGTSQTVMLKVIVNGQPQAPVITQSGNMLICNYTNGIQWFLNGNPVSGGTNDTLNAMQSGVYTVSYLDSLGCGNNSAGYNFIFTTLAQLSENILLSVFPNPVFQTLHVKANRNLDKIVIADLSGRLLSEHIVHGAVRDYTIEMAMEAGTYLVQVKTGDLVRTFKLVKMDK